jgi:tetratricopeptide (TPR) repeat protein
MTRKRALLALCVVCLAAASARAESLDQLFAAAVAAQSGARYDEAVRAYERLVEAGVDDPDVCFNLASSYGKLGRYGHAIQYFERTLRLAPGDSAARAGLKRATEALGTRQARERGEAIVTERPALLAAAYGGVSRGAVAWALWLGAWLFGACALALLFVRTEALRIAVGIGCTVAGLVAGLAGLGLATKRELGAAGVPALVVDAETELRQGPDPTAEHLDTLYEGARLRVLARSGQSVRVQLPDGREGYAAIGSIGQL